MARQRSHGGGSLFKRGGRGPYIAKWFDAEGRRVERSTRTTDKAAADRILSKRVADVALRRDGVVDARLDAINEHARTSIESHLSDYEAKIRTGGRTEKHIDLQTTRIRAAVDHAGWRVAGDIEPDGLNAYAGSMKQAGAAAQTIKNHLRAVKGFSRWLYVNGKLTHDPLVSVHLPSTKTDRRRERRMLLPDEWEWLRHATVNGDNHHGMTGAERVLLYATAIQTGLRSSELRSLTSGSLHLDAERPYVVCKAGSTKNRKDARQYVKNDLAADLRDHVAKKLPTVPVFAMPAKWDVAEMLRADLADSRGQWIDSVKHDPAEQQKRTESDFLAAKNHEGEHLDFHALRHTCGAWLAMTGAHPKAIQTVMRHSTITLTMDTYGHLVPGQEADTIAELPDMMGGADREAQRATGTACANPMTPPPVTPPLGARNGANARSVPRREKIECHNTTRHETLRNKGRRDTKRSGAKQNNNEADGIRTRNLRIDSPVL